ncbi:receptor protein-tyrosine kinase CEPR1-like protein, partial [Tanacetum coccineum]
MLTGTLSHSICKLPKLILLYIYGNSLTAQIPQALEDSKTLEKLPLYNNSYTGEIPPRIRSPPLSIVGLPDNQLTGELPLEICDGGRSSPLRIVDLDDNQFAGELPLEICNGGQGRSSPLSIVDLANNQLRGELPLEIYNGVSLCKSRKRLSPPHTVDMADNQLTGELPLEIYDRDKLSYLIAQIKTSISLWKHSHWANPTRRSSPSCIVNSDDNQLTGELLLEVCDR